LFDAAADDDARTGMPARSKLSRKNTKTRSSYSTMAKTSADKSKKGNPSIAVNRQAGHEYFVEERFEAGLALQGWEVKSLRAGRAQLKESYVTLKNGEAWLIGAHVSPLTSASTHIDPDPTRTRKLLLHRHELHRLIGQVERKGYTLIPLALYWSKGRAKLEIGLAKGKQLHDKRATEKDRDWQRERQRVMKQR
jgi:SsrA-binding protein